MSVAPVTGTLRIGGSEHRLSVAANQQLDLIDEQFVCTADPGLVLPTT